MPWSNGGGGSDPCMGQGHTSHKFSSSIFLVIVKHLTHIYYYMFTFMATKNKLHMWLLAIPMACLGPTWAVNNVCIKTYYQNVYILIVYVAIYK